MEGRAPATHRVTPGLWGFRAAEGRRIPIPTPRCLHLSFQHFGHSGPPSPLCSASHLRQLSSPAGFNSSMEHSSISFSLSGPFGMVPLLQGGGHRLFSKDGVAGPRTCSSYRAHSYSPSPLFGDPPPSPAWPMRAFHPPAFLATVIGSRLGAWPKQSQSEPIILHLGDDR